MTARESANTLLMRCPVCRYDLTGLPTKHHCPECGFIYDATTRIWRFAEPIVAPCLVSASILIPAVARVDPRFSLLIGISSWVLLTIPVAVLLYAVALMIEVRRNTFVAVSNFGLTYRKPFGRVQSIRWSEIEVMPRSGRVVRVHGETRKKLRIFRYGLGDRIRNPESLLEAIKARARVLEKEDL